MLHFWKISRKARTRCGESGPEHTCHELSNAYRREKTAKQAALSTSCQRATPELFVCTIIVAHRVVRN